MQRPNFESVTACIKIPVNLQMILLLANITDGAFHADLSAHISFNHCLDLHSTSSNTHTHKKPLRRPLMLVITLLSLCCNLCANYYSASHSYWSDTFDPTRSVSNRLSEGLNKAKWRVSWDVTTLPCQTAMSGCCRLPGTEVFYLALRRTGALCSSTTERMPKVFLLGSYHRCWRADKTSH